MCACSRNSASAMRNCARPWNIRRRPPRCSVSSAARDVQPVLDAIVESATRVCGIDDVTLRLREGNAMVVRAHFGPIPVPTGRTKTNIDDPRFLWIREHGTLHIPDVSQQNDFPIVNISGSRTFLIVPL